MPFFTEWINASSMEEIFATPLRHFPTGNSSSGISGSRYFSLILSRERIRKRVRLCRIRTLVDIVTETATVSFKTLSPLAFHCQQSPRVLLHAVLSSDSWPRRSFPNFRFWRKFCLILFSISSSICENQVLFFLVNLHIVQNSSTVLGFQILAF